MTVSAISTRISPNLMQSSNGVGRKLPNHSFEADGFAAAQLKR
jgi:hypothetical protein